LRPSSRTGTGSCSSAFAGADILIELNTRGRICFASGAIAALGKPAADLDRLPFMALVDQDDQDRARALLGDIRKGLQKTSGVLDFESANGSAFPMRVSGYRIPEMNDHCFLSLTCVEAPAAPEPPMAAMSVEGFTARAADALRTAAAAGQDIGLTLVQLGDLGSLRARSGVDEVRAFTDEILVQLAAMSLAGGTATTIGGDKYGLLHDGKADLEELRDTIAKKSRAIDPSGEGIEVGAASLLLAGHELSETDAVRALVYTMSQFAHSDDSLGIASLRQAYESMLRDTAGRVESFRRLVRDGNFRIAYQPVVSLAGGGVHHYEAQVRFADTGAESSPVTLISFAEDVGLIAEFDRATCQRVATALQGTDTSLPPVAVNLSARSIVHPAQFAALREMLRGFEGLNRQLLLEVTESFAITDLPAATAALGALRDDGYVLSLDNFGVGAANLDYLRNFPVHYVKFDSSYVRGLLTTPKSQTFLRAMVALCRTLDMKTVAQNVSNEETAKLLLQIGVDLAQGYHIGKPDFNVPGLTET
jgi:EAL domain-containing protein (putative c-di-GMP-specific phosphodiesterase class I)